MASADTRATRATGSAFGSYDRASPTRTAAERIPSLDGLRALSIAAVLLGHLAGTAGTPRWLSAELFRRFDIANYGVRVFFVISGYLITRLLVTEHERTGTVGLGRFYLRRTFRIVPAYVVLLVVLAVLVAVAGFQATGNDFVHALTYTVNYSAHRSWNVGHLWSLSVEEQFYLLWPLAFLLAGPVRATRVALAVVLVVPLIRIAHTVAFPPAGFLVGNTFETTADALALGCLLGTTQAHWTRSAFWQRVLASRVLIPLLFLVGVGFSLRYRPSLLIGISLCNAAIALWIARCVHRPHGRVGRLLNHPALVYVGTLSYSIYLWQQLFLNRNSTAWYAAFPANLVCAAIAALASYYLVERPGLTVRHRLEQRFGRRRVPHAVPASATSVMAPGDDGRMVGHAPAV